MFPDVGGDLPTKGVASVVHCEQQALDVDLLIELLSHQPDRGDESGEALEGVVLALNRDQQGVS